jgi:hypothetical protein
MAFLRARTLRLPRRSSSFPSFGKNTRRLTRRVAAFRGGWTRTRGNAQNPCIDRFLNPGEAGAGEGPRPKRPAETEENRKSCFGMLSSDRPLRAVSTFRLFSGSTQVVSNYRYRKNLAGVSADVKSQSWTRWPSSGRVETRKPYEKAAWGFRRAPGKRAKIAQRLRLHREDMTG